MEARQIRRRHFFHSSVGSLLNENHNPALSPVSERTSHRPFSRSQCNSVDGSSTHIDKPSRELPSDLQEINDNSRFDAQPISHDSNNELNNDTLLNRHSRSSSAISVTASESCLGVPRKLGVNRSTLTWPEYNGQTSRQSTPSCATTSSEYRPFSSTTDDFIGGKFRFSPVSTPQSVDHTAKLEPPQYYDAYREIMNGKSKSSVCSVTQCDTNIDTLTKIEFPYNLQIAQEPYHSIESAQRAPSSHSTGSAQRAPSSHSTGSAQRAPSSHFTGSAKRAPSSHSTGSAQRAPSSHSTGSSQRVPSSHSTGSAERAPSSHSTGSARRASSSHSTGSAQRDSSNRLTTPASSRVSQQKCTNTPPVISDQRKSSSRSSSAASMSSLLNQQKLNVFYTGRTPTRTPSPDYRLPVFPSQAWIKHYSPTYIRHFMRAANPTINN